MPVVPFGLVLQSPRHAWGRSQYNGTPLGYLYISASFSFHPFSSLLAQRYAPFLRFVAGTLNSPLNTGDKIEVLVERGWGRQLMTLPICCGVSSARALCPKLVTLETSQRTGLKGAAWAFVFWSVTMARAESEGRMRTRARE